MAGGIKIPVEAEVNQSSVDRSAGKIEQGFDRATRSADELAVRVERSLKALEKLSKIKIQPFDQKGLDALDALLKRVEAAGKNAPPPVAPATPPPSGFVPAPPSPRAPITNPRYYSHRWKHSMVGGILHAGLGAAGPAGSVISGSISRGMMVGAQSGVGAGMAAGAMGLLGGLLAIGVGKAIGGVMNKVSDAQQEAIALSDLRKRVGATSADFEALRKNVRLGGDAFSIEYNEAVKLASAYVGQTGRFSANDFTLGAGFSRAYGMDPAAGVGLFGAAEHTGVKENHQRLALAIAEAISRTKFGAMMPEVLQALTSYMSGQSHATFNAPNVSGYLGLFSTLMASGRPGLDVAGSAELVNHLNASIAHGGTSPAAQNFMFSVLGRDLNPVQAMVLQSGGAFATRSQMFGKDSMAAAWAQAVGERNMPAISGGQTLDAVMGGMKRFVPNNWLRLNAWQGAFGLGPQQAMALEAYLPAIRASKVNGMVSDDQLMKLNADAIQAVGAAGSADRSQLSSMAAGIIGRRGVESGDATRLRALVAGGSDEDLRKAVVDMTVKYGTATDVGEQTRDATVRTANTLQDLADNLLPPINAMKNAMLSIAGGYTPKNAADMARYAADFERNSAMSGDTSVAAAQADFNATLNPFGQWFAEHISEDWAANRPEQKAALARLKAARAGATDRYNKRSFSEKWMPYAQAAGKELGVDPNIILAQWGLESGYGTNTLAEFNNLGSIKANGWGGSKVGDYRAYASADEWVKDYVDQIRRNFSGSVGAGSDVSKFTDGLQNGRLGAYAEDRDYASKIASTAESINLSISGGGEMVLRDSSGNAVGSGSFSMPKTRQRLPRSVGTTVMGD